MLQISNAMHEILAIVTAARNFGEIAEVGASTLETSLTNSSSSFRLQIGVPRSNTFVLLLVVEYILAGFLASRQEFRRSKRVANAGGFSEFDRDGLTQ
jgi:hypothetical protein